MFNHNFKFLSSFSLFVANINSAQVQKEIQKIT